MTAKNKNDDEQHANNNQHEEQNQTEDEVVIIDKTSPRYITPEDVAATLVVEGDEDGWDDDDDDDDDDDKNNNNNSFHTDLVADWGSWPMGTEMSVKLLAEKRHRHNHRVSEKRREGFPKIRHYNTWEVDELQLLVYKNRGFFLFPHWSNSSE